MKKSCIVLSVVLLLILSQPIHTQSPLPIPRGVTVDQLVAATILQEWPANRILAPDERRCGPYLIVLTDAKGDDKQMYLEYTTPNFLSGGTMVIYRNLPKQYEVVLGERREGLPPTVQIGTSTKKDPLPKITLGMSYGDYEKAKECLSGSKVTVVQYFYTPAPTP